MACDGCGAENRADASFELRTHSTRGVDALGVGITLLRLRDGRVTYAEHFAEHDRDRAEARFDELAAEGDAAEG